MRLSKIFLFSIALLFSSAQAWAESAKDAIAAANEAFMKAYNAKDTAAVAAMYTEDAAILPAGGVRADGRADIQKYWQAMVDFGLVDFTLSTTEFQEAGDWAYEVGTYTAKFPDNDKKMVDDKGKYIVIWKKGSDNSWKLYRDIWNDDAMP